MKMKEKSKKTNKKDKKEEVLHGEREKAGRRAKAR